MGLVATKPVFGVSAKARLNPVSSATETSLNIAISLEASLDMMLHSKRSTKALISLCCLQTHEDRVFRVEDELSYSPKKLIKHYFHIICIAQCII